MKLQASNKSTPEGQSLWGTFVGDFYAITRFRPDSLAV